MRARSLIVHVLIFKVYHEVFQPMRLSRKDFAKMLKSTRSQSRQTFLRIQLLIEKLDGFIYEKLVFYFKTTI